ncbi:MAG: hypothetical protein AAF327_24600, partial [Cyanobacteria bacterium P01_A01_bin.37]
MRIDTNTLNHGSLQSLSPIEKTTRFRKASVKSLRSALEALTRWFMSSNDHLKIWQVGDLWSAANTQTGQAIYRVSEDEIRCWIEDQIRGTSPSVPSIAER